MAAVLASGIDAVLSHETAAALWGIRPSASARVTLTTPRKLRPNAKLIRHCAVLHPDEVTTHNGIPTCTPARTLFDLAAVLQPHALARAFEQADILRLLDTKPITELLDRHPRRKGTARLRPLLNAAVDVPQTRLELERRFFTFLEDNSLPRPRINTVVETFEVDFAWPQQHLIAELDGFETHGTRHAFERDRARDRRLQSAGWRVIRITWRHLHDGPGALARELRALLAI